MMQVWREERFRGFNIIKGGIKIGDLPVQAVAGVGDIGAVPLVVNREHTGGTLRKEVPPAN